MTMYSPEEMRKEAENIDLNHPGWWKVAAMLRQGADAIKALAGAETQKSGGAS
jgi:hypothetical protein